MGKQIPKTERMSVLLFLLALLVAPVTTKAQININGTSFDVNAGLPYIITNAGTFTVTDSLIDADKTLQFDISTTDIVTIIWEATLTSDNPFIGKLLEITGTGSIYSTLVVNGTMTTLGSLCNAVVTRGNVIVNGGVIQTWGTGSAAIIADGYVTVNDGTVASDGNYSVAIFANGDVTLNGGMVVTNGHDSCSISSGGNVYVNGGTVAANGNNGVDITTAEDGSVIFTDDSQR